MDTEYTAISAFVQICGAVFVIWLIWRWFSGKSADDTARVDTKDT